MIYRRQCIHAAMLLLTARAMSMPAAVALAQQANKPQVKISEAKPLIVHYVDKMAQD